MRGWSVAVALAVVALGLGACATVGVADKEVFTWPCMGFDQQRSNQGFIDHVFLTQEQADGGAGGEGGGCGCR